jgi:cytoskeletal protein CcmA (bactofilin family)
MFGKKAIPHEIGSLIGAGTTVNGDVNFSGGLRVDGTVRGAVRCAEGDKGGVLVVSEHGSIEGEVRASHLVVAGRIQGPVHASELVELQPKAQVHGDVQYRALEMHHGAIVEGLMVHIPAEGRSAAKAAVGAAARQEKAATQS